MENFCIEFEVNNVERFRSLAHVFEELQKDKSAESFRGNSEWLRMFDEQARSHFWWPTEEEREAHFQLWQTTRVSRRLTDPRLQKPWDFGSMIEAFQNGEYALVSCRMISADRARLEFNPFAHPFGGTECMKALIEAFGFRMVKDYDDEE